MRQTAALVFREYWDGEIGEIPAFLGGAEGEDWMT